MNDDHLLLLCCARVGFENGLVCHLLVVDQHELGLALQQSGHAVDQHLGRPDAPILDRVERTLAVAVAYVFADESLQLRAFTCQEQRCAFEVFAVVRVINLAVTRVVVQVGAGLQRHGAVLHSGVEVLQVGRVRPGLVGRVSALAFACAAAAARPHDGVLIAAAGFRPLLELDDHDLRSCRGVLAGNHEVDALGGLWQLVLDGHAGVLGNLLVPQHLGHLQQRVLPGLHLGRTDAVARRAAVVTRHHVLDVVAQCVVQELALAGLVDDHRGWALKVRRTSCWCNAPRPPGTSAR